MGSTGRGLVCVDEVCTRSSSYLMRITVRLVCVHDVCRISGSHSYELPDDY
jgi:hypothetical protein